MEGEKVTTRWVSLVIHGVVLEHQSQPGGVESGQPNDIQYPVDVAVRSHSIVRTDSLDTRHQSLLPIRLR